MTIINFKIKVELAYYAFRAYVVKKIVGNDPVIMNITITNDILKYNKIGTERHPILHGLQIKNVSDRQSFVYNPCNTIYTH